MVEFGVTAATCNQQNELDEDVEGWEHMRVDIGSFIVNLTKWAAAHTHGHILMCSISHFYMRLLDVEEIVHLL